jgi:3-hydroxybutyryl-CoA dehydratase
MSAGEASFTTLEVGDRLTGKMTVTDAHITLAAGIFGDLAPLHVDDEYARATRYGGRVAHGPLVLGIMTGVLGMSIGPNAHGLLELRNRFRAPVLAGDTVKTTWEVIEMVDKPRLGGGIVSLSGTCAKGDVVAVEATAVMIVGYGAEAPVEATS